MAKKATSNISFDDAVTEGKKIVAETARLERTNNLRLGELADTVEPKYAEQTLAKFAKAIGVASCTLARHRSVYRKWKDIKAPGPVSYAVMRELQDYDDRAVAVTENPRMTKAQARELMGKSKAACKPRGFERDTARWLRGVVSLANDIIREAAGIAELPSDYLVEPALLPTLRLAATALQEMVNCLENEASRPVPELVRKVA